jgi:acyl carrier protein
VRSLADLRQILGEVLAMPAVTLNDQVNLEDIATWNSMVHIELVVRLEETYGIELTQDDIVEMTSIGAIRDVLRRRGKTLD